MNFFQETWTLYRPYAIRLLVDFLVSLSFWLALFLFEKLRLLLPIVGWAATFIDNLHSAGTVIGFLIFVILFILDIWRLRSKN
jgi:hypothetical protein